MRVLMVSTSYPRDSSDWRGVFIRALVEATARRTDIQLSLWAPPGKVPVGVYRAATNDESHWLSWLMERGGISHLIRHPSPFNLHAPLHLLRRLRAVYLRNTDVDLYHINWLQCALPLPDNGIPALISVLGNDLKLLRLPLMRRLLRRAMRRRRVILCPNAEWMLGPLDAAFSDVAEIEPVSFGVDARWFAIERTTRTPSRWVAITRLTADKLGPLLEWSKPLFSNGVRELHLFGPMQEKTRLPDWIYYHGAIDSNALVYEWFPSATGLITLSRHAEGRPQIMLEAMAAGLPIVASRMPAHATVVRDGLTGILCDSIDGYVRAIEQTEDIATNSRFGMAARSIAKNEFGTWDDCVNRYSQIYSRLCGSSSHG